MKPTINTYYVRKEIIMSKDNKTIKCPECGAALPISESTYNQILDQVKNEEFNKSIDNIKNQYKEQLHREVEAYKEAEDAKLEAKIEEKRRHFVELKNKSETEIKELRNQISSAEKDKEIALAKVSNQKEKELSELNLKIASLQKELSMKADNYNNKLDAIKAKLENEGKDKLNQLSKDKENEIAGLKSRIDVLTAENEFKDDQIASLKDFKTRLSTKMLGETLEQHCEQSYERYLRPSLPNAEFDKDTATGEKGDYIFREYDASGKEQLSILFEMKNQDDDSDSKKKKNKDHFAKLDKDRTRRNCQIAVLVSMLEPDNEKYNAGITYVTEGYEKMYVIRPQCFVDIINLLRGVSIEKAKLEDELELERSKSVDVSNFENLLDDYKLQISKNSDMAKSHSEDIIKQIDKFIAALEKHKEKVLAWQKQCEIADKKSSQVTIKTLTKNNPTVKNMFTGKEKEEDEEVW